MNKRQNIFFTILRFAAAMILLQTLAYKFTAHPDSVQLFTTLGLEPFGRIGIGILELIAGGLLLYKRFAWLGAILGLGLMSGAIFSHLAILGIAFNGDGGSLFAMAVITFICCAGTLFLQRAELYRILPLKFQKKFS